MHDRMIAGGAMPVKEVLELKPIDILRSDYFLERREMGIFNVGGKGIVKAGDSAYTLEYKEALYLGRGARKVTFESVDPANPALFYFCSSTAHTSYPDHLTTREDAVKMELGTLEESNHRVINRMLVKEVVPTCQLQMGMTELKPGSTWNTMPTIIKASRFTYNFIIPASITPPNTNFDMSRQYLPTSANITSLSTFPFPISQI